MSAFNLGTGSQTASRLALSATIILLPAVVEAENFTAGTVMQKMSSDERFAYVAGVVEGLAVSRYMQDGKKPDGMNCIYDWFYKTPNTAEKIYDAFRHFPDYLPGSVIDALARKACA